MLRVFLLFLLLSLLFPLFLNVVHRHLHQLQAHFLVLLGFFSLCGVALLLHLVSDLRLQLEQVRLHRVEEVAFALRNFPLLVKLFLVLLLLLFLDTDRFAIFINAIETSVHIFMVHEISEWHHQRNSWPIRAESAVCCQDVDVFEFVHRNVRFSIEVRILSQHGVQLLPLGEELILTFLSIFNKCRVLQILEILILPIHQNVGLLRPRLERLVVDRLFTESDLIEDVSVEDVVLT